MNNTDTIMSDADLMRVFGTERRYVGTLTGIEFAHSLRAVANYAAAMTREPQRPRLVSLTHMRQIINDALEYAFSEAVWDDGTVMQKTVGGEWAIVQKIPHSEELRDYPLTSRND